MPHSGVVGSVSHKINKILHKVMNNQISLNPKPVCSLVSLKFAMYIIIVRCQTNNQINPPGKLPIMVMSLQSIGLGIGSRLQQFVYLDQSILNLHTHKVESG